MFTDYRLDISKLNTKARRNLKIEDLAALYSEDELQVLLDYPSEYAPQTIPELPYDEAFYEQENKAKRRKLIRRWTPEEDEFLEATYMYLSDAAIALALNMPIAVIRARRKTKELYKPQTTDLEVIVWHNREDFDKDMRLYHLTKARPEAF